MIRTRNFICRTAVLLGLQLSGFAIADGFVDLHAADGTRSFQGRPVAVVSMEREIVRIEKKQSGMLDVPLDAFAEPDRLELRRWMKNVVGHPGQALVARFKAATKPAVLFIGNSYSFEVPKEFERIASAEGHPVIVEQITTGGWRLSQHAASPQTTALIKSRQWDVVVLQEQSLIPAFPQDQRDASMLPAIKQLVELIGENGSIPVLYETWGRRDGDLENAGVFPNDTYTAMHLRLVAGFKAAHDAAPSLVGVRVGDAWEKRMKAGGGLALYSPDGSHPSRSGIHLAAAVFYSTFFNGPVTKTPENVENGAELERLAADIGCLQLPPYPLPAE